MVQKSNVVAREQYGFGRSGQGKPGKAHRGKPGTRTRRHEETEELSAGAGARRGAARNY